MSSSFHGGLQRRRDPGAISPTHQRRAPSSVSPIYRVVDPAWPWRRASGSTELITAACGPHGCSRVTPPYCRFPGPRAEDLALGESGLQRASRNGNRCLGYLRRLARPQRHASRCTSEILLGWYCCSSTPASIRKPRLTACLVFRLPRPAFIASASSRGWEFSASALLSSPGGCAADISQHGQILRPTTGAWCVMSFAVCLPPPSGQQQNSIAGIGQYLWMMVKK